MFLIVNVGSTSIKTRLFDHDLQSLALLNAEYGVSAGLVIRGHDVNGGSRDRQMPAVRDAEGAVSVVLSEWQEIIAEHSLTLSGIGHRIVHGGNRFDAIAPISKQMLSSIINLDAYAPLHNPLNRLGVATSGGIFPDIPQYAVFDTAFHRRIPEYAGRYAIPSKLSGKVDFYRYGFHGISCRHSLSAAAELLNREPTALNLIVLHLGGGASATAIKAGVSVDTSMGFSPTEGLIMAGRSGDLDPMIPVTLQREGWSLEQLDHLLNHDSGLRGICGESDMRSILERAELGDETAALAIDMYCYRIKKYIGAYCAVLGQVFAVIFTGGIGEHAFVIREKVMQGLDQLGFLIDPAANRREAGHNRDISLAASRSRILVIRAEEEREIARQMIEFRGTAPGNMTKGVLF